MQERGEINWSREPSADGFDRVNGVAIDSNGDVYATGEFDGTLDFGTSASDPNQSVSLTSSGYGDIFVTKYAADGTVHWAQRAGSSDASDAGRAIAVDGNSLYVGGSFQGEADFGSQTLRAYTAKGSPTSGTWDGFISRMNAGDGAFQWTEQVGGDGQDHVEGVAIDQAADAVYATGQFDGEAFAGDFTISSHGSRDGFVTRQDTSGNFVWANGFGGTEHDVGGRDLAVRTNGDVTVTGGCVQEAHFDNVVLSNPDNDDDGSPDRYTSSFFATANSAGTFQDAGLIQPGTGYGVSVDGNDNVYLTGEAYNDGEFYSFPTGETLVTDHYDVYLTKRQSALPHDVAVTDLNAPSVIVQGDSASVDVSVEHQGSNDETFDVTLTSDNGTPDDSGDDFEIDSWADVALLSGSSTTLTATWDTTDVDLADHTLMAEAILSTDEDTANNTATASVSVEAERHDVAVTELTAPSPVTEGDVVDVDALVENQGNRSETFDVTLSYDTASSSRRPSRSIMVPPRSSPVHGTLTASPPPTIR